MGSKKKVVAKKAAPKKVTKKVLKKTVIAAPEKIVAATPVKKSPYKIKILPTNGKFEWNLLNAKNKPVASSAISFDTMAKAATSARTFSQTLVRIAPTLLTA